MPRRKKATAPKESTTPVLDYCYELIKAHYGDRRAQRSGALLMDHIDEGLRFLNTTHMGCTEEVQAAWCIHPMIQGDDKCAFNFAYLAARVPANVLGLALEYRKTANAYLPGMRAPENLLSPLHQVNAMLYADKMQNHHALRTYPDTVPNYAELDHYFSTWLYALRKSVVLF